MTAPLERLERDLEEDPYPSLAHVRTSASGLLRFPDSEGPDGEEGERALPSCTTLARADSENHSQCRLLPSPYPYWGDEEEDMPSPSQKDPFTGYVGHKSLNSKNTFVIFQFTKANENNESEFDGEAAGAARHPVRGHPRGALRDQGTIAPTHSKVSTSLCFT